MGGLLPFSRREVFRKTRGNSNASVYDFRIKRKLKIAWNLGAVLRNTTLLVDAVRRDGGGLAGVHAIGGGASRLAGHTDLRSDQGTGENDQCRTRKKECDGLAHGGTPFEENGNVTVEVRLRGAVYWPKLASSIAEFVELRVNASMSPTAAFVPHKMLVGCAVEHACLFSGRMKKPAAWAGFVRKE
jgi:hypothetical protein